MRTGHLTPSKRVFVLEGDRGSRSTVQLPPTLSALRRLAAGRVLRTSDAGSVDLFLNGHTLLTDANFRALRDGDTLVVRDVRGYCTSASSAPRSFHCWHHN